MMPNGQVLAKVAAISDIAADLRHVIFVPADGGRFAASSAGAHIIVTLRDGPRVWRNAYSLISAPGERASYAIIVRRAAPSRGGSAYIHSQLAPGDQVFLTGPHNMFWPSTTARKHLMLAAGIGVTPFLSYLPAFASAGIEFELHLRCRPGEADIFRSLLQKWPNTHVHSISGRHRFLLTDILTDQPLGTHLYLCGPSGFMQDMRQFAGDAGWPGGKIHQESFGAATTGAGFRAILARSGLTIDVAADQPLLDAIEEAGISAPSLCRGGACGHCQIDVIDGEPDHRDHFLSPAARARGNVMMACVSRAKTPTLVLDI